MKIPVQTEWGNLSLMIVQRDIKDNLICLCWGFSEIIFSILIDIVDIL